MKLPQDFADRMKFLLKNEYEEFLKSYDNELYRGVRVNPLKDIGDECFADLERVPWCRNGYYLNDGRINGNHPLHSGGAIYFQEPSAMAAAEALPIIEGGRVLDLCAAPGGKTTHIAARMKNRGLLVSNEIVPKRAAILAENVERMGLCNTVVTNETPSRLAERFGGFFDGIIVDAPCSGEGMFRKEPQAIDEWSVNHTLSCAVRQKNILDDAYKMLKCGGYIVYSTCTFSYDENESVVKYMMNTYNMELCEIPCLDMLSPGIGEGMEKCRRVFPHREKGEGHFVALMRRTEENADKPKKEKKAAVTDKGLTEAVAYYREFEKKQLSAKLDGEFVLFGDNLYLLPEAVNIDKLKIVRCGLHLGTMKRNRFEPAHALSHALKTDEYINKVELPSYSDMAARYMHGETVESAVNGWCAVVSDGIVLGWGKGSNGIVKNHYPKHLRIL